MPRKKAEAPAPAEEAEVVVGSKRKASVAASKAIVAHSESSGSDDKPNESSGGKKRGRASKPDSDNESNGSDVEMFSSGILPRPRAAKERKQVVMFKPSSTPVRGPSSSRGSNSAKGSNAGNGGKGSNSGKSSKGKSKGGRAGKKADVVAAPARGRSAAKGGSVAKGKPRKKGAAPSRAGERSKAKVSYRETDDNSSDASSSGDEADSEEEEEASDADSVRSESSSDEDGEEEQVEELGAHLEVQGKEGAWYDCQLVQLKGSKAKVHTEDGDNDEAFWVEAALLRHRSVPMEEDDEFLRIGTRVLALWENDEEGHFFDAVVSDIADKGAQPPQNAISPPSSEPKSEAPAAEAKASEAPAALPPPASPEEEESVPKKLSGLYPGWKKAALAEAAALAAAAAEAPAAATSEAKIEVPGKSEAPASGTSDVKMEVVAGTSEVPAAGSAEVKPEEKEEKEESRPEPPARFQVKWRAGPEKGARKWLSILALNLANRKSIMTPEKLAASYPHLAAATLAGRVRARPEEDDWDDAFLPAWIKTAKVPERARDAINVGMGLRNVKAIDIILAWRAPAGSEGSPNEREFLVKWADCSFRAAQWIPRKVLVHIAYMKLTNFERQSGIVVLWKTAGGVTGAKPKEPSSDDDEEGNSDDGDADTVDGIRAEWLAIDRIVAEDKATGVLMVKWRGMHYDQATWEKRASLESDADQEAVLRFHADNVRYKVRAAAQRKTGKPASAKKARTEEPVLHEVVGHPPYLTNGTLFPYQLEGLNWLRRKRFQGLGAMLADEMGLGKTVQIVALTASVFMEEGDGTRPFLVVVPLSTLPNWRREFAKWAPQLNFLAYEGNQDARKIIRAQEFDPKALGCTRFDVLCVSYEVALSDANILTRFNWDTLVVDEGHRLKNDKSSLFGALARLRTTNKVLLTGTPLQNNLDELFNLMSFLTKAVPGQSEHEGGKKKGGNKEGKKEGTDEAPTNFFPTMEAFEAKFAGKSADSKVSALHAALAPFVLRRLKKDQQCLKLAPKIERVVQVGLSPVQREYYAACLTRNFRILNGANKDDRRVSLLNVLMELRKCCNHAYLFDSAIPPAPSKEAEHVLLTGASGKLIFLQQILPKLFQNGSKVLIFSQFTTMLNILEKFLTFLRYTYVRIDGNVPGNERQRLIDQFNDKDGTVFVFLLSTRAGGQGINLASADTVILYDTDFNPHRDMQALARAHRIGQSRPVVVLRLITRSSVEEKILVVAQRKAELEKTIIDKGGTKASGALTNSDAQEILRCGAGAIMHTQAHKLEVIGEADKGADIPRELRNIQIGGGAGDGPSLEDEAKASKAVQDSLASAQSLQLSSDQLDALLDRTFTDEDSPEEKGGALNSFSGDAEGGGKAKAGRPKADQGASNEEYWTELLQERAREREHQEQVALGRGMRGVSKKEVSYKEDASSEDEEGPDGEMRKKVKDQSKNKKALLAKDKTKKGPLGKPGAPGLPGVPLTLNPNAYPAQGDPGGFAGPPNLFSPSSGTEYVQRESSSEEDSSSEDGNPNKKDSKTGKKRGPYKKKEGGSRRKPEEAANGSNVAPGIGNGSNVAPGIGALAGAGPQQAAGGSWQEHQRMRQAQIQAAEAALPNQGNRRLETLSGGAGGSAHAHQTAFEQFAAGGSSGLAGSFGQMPQYGYQQHQAAMGQQQQQQHNQAQNQLGLQAYQAYLQQMQAQNYGRSWDPPQ